MKHWKTHLRWIAPAATGLLALGALAGPTHARVTTDAALLDAVEKQIVNDPGLEIDGLDVTVKNGIVTFNGEIDELIDHYRLVRVAEGVRGVKAVETNVTIMAEPDQSVHERVHEALSADPETDEYGIDASATDGVVTLSGTVDNWAEAQLAEQIASHVQGVVEIDNQIEWENAGANDRLVQVIDRALLWNPSVDGMAIDVRHDGDRIILGGTVTSASEKRAAIEAARAMGAATVDAEALTIRADADQRRARKDRRPANDDQIRQAVTAALGDEPRTDQFDLAVTVDDGVVTLRGEVDNLKAERAARRAARNVANVERVDLRIRVRPDAQLTEAQIERAVTDSFEREVTVEAVQVDVEVRGNTAILTGTVDSWLEKAQADEAAAGVKGVQRVRNRLQVNEPRVTWVEDEVGDYDLLDFDWLELEPGYTLDSDEQIAEEIRDEYFWSPFVDGDDIVVTVQDGVATLTGTVEDWDDRRQATEEAFEGGAIWVRNRLEVVADANYWGL